METVLLAKNQESSLTPTQMYAMEMIRRGYSSHLKESEWAATTEVVDAYDDFVRTMALKKPPTMKLFTGELQNAIGCTVTIARTWKGNMDRMVNYFQFKSEKETKDYFLKKFPAARYLLKQTDPTLNYNTVEDEERMKWLGTMTEDSLLIEFLPKRFRDPTDPFKVTFPCNAPTIDRENKENESPAAIKRKQMEELIERKVKNPKSPLSAANGNGNSAARDPNNNNSMF